jgi:dTDP-glucose 4,6-dehydratase
LVTGGAGFIGSQFIRQNLLNAGAGSARIELIVCLDKLSYAGNPANLADLKGTPSFIFVHGDISDREQVLLLLSHHQITGIIHLAAESHVDRSISSPEIFFQTNVLGTQRLLESARFYWDRLAPAKKLSFRFIHVSTDEVFGTLGEQDAPFTEQTAYAPNSPYAASKAGSDHVARAYYRTYGFPVITSFCTNNYGPYQFPEKLIPLTILNCLEQKPLPVYGDGGQIRDWLYVSDHVRALRMVLEGGRPGEAYAIGGMNEIRNLDLVRQICVLLDELQPRAQGRRYDELISFVVDRPGHDRRYAINCHKIKHELDWQPLENFVRGLRTTIQWYIANRDWCAGIQARTEQQDRQNLECESIAQP